MAASLGQCLLYDASKCSANTRAVGPTAAQEMQDAQQLLHCCCICCPLLQRLDASPIKEGLRQFAEGCDGRHVQVSTCDASRLKMFFNDCFSMFFLVRSVTGRRPFLRTLVLQVLPSSTDSIALVVLYFLRHAPRRHCFKAQ